MRKQVFHDVLNSSGFVQAGGCSSTHQSFGNYFEGENPWVLFDLTNQVHRALNIPVLSSRHRVVTCCNHLPPHRLHKVFQRPSRIHPAKLVNEPGFLQIYSKLLSTESSCIQRWASSFAGPSRARCLTPDIYFELDKLVVAQGCHLKNASKTHQSYILNARRRAAIV